jgi:hypothetical protein
VVAGNRGFGEPGRDSDRYGRFPAQARGAPARHADPPVPHVAVHHGLGPAPASAGAATGRGPRPPSRQGAGACATPSRRPVKIDRDSRTFARAGQISRSIRSGVLRRPRCRSKGNTPLRVSRRRGPRRPKARTGPARLHFGASQARYSESSRAGRDRYSLRGGCRKTRGVWTVSGIWPVGLLCVAARCVRERAEERGARADPCCETLEMQGKRNSRPTARPTHARGRPTTPPHPHSPAPAAAKIIPARVLRHPRRVGKMTTAAADDHPGRARNRWVSVEGAITSGIRKEAHPQSEQGLVTCEQLRAPGSPGRAPGQSRAPGPRGRCRWAGSWGCLQPASC